MSLHGKFSSDETLGESWVMCPTPGDRVTPLPFATGSEEYLRLLRDAQRDSTHSSARHSLASSRRDTPRDSPKSPPNSPNTELSTEDELKGIYINHTCHKDFDLGRSTEWLSELCGKPEPSFAKEMKHKHVGLNRRKTYSIRTAKLGKNNLFSKEVLYTLLLTNLISILIGTGIGVWLTRRGLMVPRVSFE